MKHTSKSDKGLFWRFLISRTFFVNLGIAIVIVIVFLLLSMKFLDIYTRHGKELAVPDVRGMTMKEIKDYGLDKSFDFSVTDSLYDDNSKKGSVILQDPLPGSKVKKGRSIYVSVVAMLPERVIMPDLRDLSVRQAVNILESKKMTVGKLIYEPSFDKNAVLEQFYQGDTVKPGDTLVKGSVIDLIVGSGDKQYRIPIPFLIGKTREEAIYTLNIASFNLGREFYMDSVTDNTARVYMQDPRWDSNIPYFPGDSIHLWYRSDELFNFEPYVNSFLNDSLQPDSMQTDTFSF